jgi:large subunit ribosomal protein L29
MKASDLREKTLQDLVELRKSLGGDMFQNRLKNFTNRLDDTSSIRKARRDLARVMTVIRQVELRSPGVGLTVPASTPAEQSPSAESPAEKHKSRASAMPLDAKRASKKDAEGAAASAASPKKSSKKSEASSR